MAIATRNFRYQDDAIVEERLTDARPRRRWPAAKCCAPECTHVIAVDSCP
jgi:hypothetical protein